MTVRWRDCRDVQSDEWSICTYSWRTPACNKHHTLIQSLNPIDNQTATNWARQMIWNSRHGLEQLENTMNRIIYDELNNLRVNLDNFVYIPDASNEMACKPLPPCVITQWSAHNSAPYISNCHTSSPRNKFTNWQSDFVWTSAKPDFRVTRTSLSGSQKFELRGCIRCQRATSTHRCEYIMCMTKYIFGVCVHGYLHLDSTHVHITT